MNIAPFPFQITNWEEIEVTEYRGETGKAYWKTQFFGEETNKIRVRLVEYSSNYLADHWCEKGHILFCLEGELESRLKDGRTFTLTSGMSYQVGDNSEPHQSFSLNGAKLLIVD
ncbi:DHCW motif cupin fold protein [Acinetobacter baumannii]